MGDQVVSLSFGDTELLVEVSSPKMGGTEFTSRQGADRLNRVGNAVTDAFDQARESILLIAGRTVETLRLAGEAAVRPDELEIKFGLKFSAKGSVVVAEASGEANLEVRLIYRSPSIDVANDSDVSEQKSPTGQSSSAHG